MEGNISPAWILLLSSCISACFGLKVVPTTKTSYVIVTSDSIVPDSELTFHLNLLDLKAEKKGNDTDECVLDIRISSDDHRLWRSLYWKIDVDETPRSFSRTVRLLTPPEDEMLEDRFEFKIESTGCFEFSRSVEIPRRWTKHLIRIRTDKKIYEPGHKVFIEATMTTPALKPYWRNLNMSLCDQYDVPIVSWMNISDENGIVRREFRLPYHIAEKELRVKVEIRNQTVYHEIKIERMSGHYERKPFIVDARVARYHTLHSTDEGKSRDLEINVVASHHCGLPVVGRLELTVSLENSTKSGKTSPVELTNGFKKYLLTTADVKKLVGLSPEESLNGRKLELRISVEEVRPSGVETNDTIRPESLVVVTENVSVNFINQSLTLHFNPHNSLHIRPGLPYHGRMTIRPVWDVPENTLTETDVTLSVKHFGNNPDTPTVENKTLKVPPNSVFEFSIKIPKEDKKIEIEALCEDKIAGRIVKARLENLLPFSTMNKEGHMIQVRLNGKPTITVGEELKAVAESTFPTSSVHYEIFSYNSLVLSGNIVSPSPTNKHEISLVIPQNMSHILSLCRLVVWTRTPSDEIVADSLGFAVDQMPDRKLELSIKPDVVEPGSLIEVRVTGDPFTVIHPVIMSGIIPSDPIELEICKRIARRKMSHYLRGLMSTHMSSDFIEICKDCSTFHSAAPDSTGVFNESRGLVLSDGMLSIDPSKPWPTPSVKNGTLDDIEPRSLYDIEEFSTSCWKSNYTIGLSGEMKFHMRVPRKARLYTVSVVGLMPGKGPIIVEEPVHVLASSKLLSSLRHPESVVRGEQAVLELELFNNETKEIKVDIEVKEKPGFKLVCLDGEKEKEESTLRRSVVLKPRESKIIPTFIVVSKTTQEPLTIEVEVISEDVHRNHTCLIPIKYPGIEVESSESATMDSLDGKQVIDLDLSKRIEKPIENSEEGSVKIYGHPMGPIIESVCKEIDAPRILNERSKMWFVGAVSVLEHLSYDPLFEHPPNLKHETSTPTNITFVDRDECIKYTRDSVEYLLNKRNPDGSYGYSPKVKGSLCITSVYLNMIDQLRNEHMIPKHEIVKTVEWIAAQQKEDGSFVDEKHLIFLSPYLKLRPESHNVVLTSHLVVSLSNAKRHLNLPKETNELIESVTKKGIEHIEKSILTNEYDNDAYALGWAVYAMVLTRRDKTNMVIRKRDALAKTEGNKIYWKPDIPPVGNTAMSVVMSSVAILSSLEMGDVIGCKPFVNYVTSLMNPEGSFVASMDTMMAARALFKYYSEYFSTHELTRLNVDVKVTLSTKTEISLKFVHPLIVETIRFDHSNISMGGPMKIESVGRGVVGVQSISKYNVPSPPSKPTDFDLNVESKKKDLEHLTLKVCSVNLKDERSEVHIVEVPGLSGYEFNTEKISNETVRPIFYQNGTAYIVLNELPPKSTSCREVELVRMYRIGNIESKYIKMYSIFDPSKPVLKPYNDENNESEIKKICPDCRC